ncbi:MAG: hypothetical protein KC414_13325 [Romboutsia sp.]|nr:hypothetical protein [Romboutsia sp.]
MHVKGILPNKLAIIRREKRKIRSILPTDLETIITTASMNKVLIEETREEETKKENNDKNNKSKKIKIPKINENIISN